MEQVLGFSKRLLCLCLVFFLTLLVAGCGDWDGVSNPAVLDTTTPVATAQAPVDDALGVPINRAISVTFNEAMAPATINESTFTLRQGATEVAGTVSYSGVTAVFTPTANLAGNTRYDATIDTAATDVAGNTLELPYTWGFTTSDAEEIVAPTVTSTIPVVNASGVPDDQSITAVFSEAMHPLTITDSSFTLSQGGTPIVGTVTYSGLTATFTPDLPLDLDLEYAATITGAATDLAGIALALPYTWLFTTGDAAPQVMDTNPLDQALNVLVNREITAVFNELMDPLTITSATFTLFDGLIQVDGDVTYEGVTATFAPQAPLDFDTEYTATITAAATDLDGTPLEGNQLPVPPAASDYVWTFTTAAETLGPPPLSLLTFGIASAGGITNIGATKINGNVILDPTASCNLQPILFADGPGFGVCGGDITNIPTINVGDQVITPLYPDTTTAHAVMADLTVKWNSLSPAGLPGGTPLAAPTTLGEPPLATLVAGDNLFVPGIYTSDTSILITGDLTLDAQGDPDASFVFQSPSTLGLEPNSRILLIGGAKASNIWWFVGSSATLGTNSVSNGNILASASVSMSTGATSCGRLLAGAEGSGAFTFLGNTVSVPGHPNAPAGCE